MLAERHGAIVGWAGVNGTDITVQGASRDTDGASLLLDWALDIVGDHQATAVAFVGDDAFRTLLSRAGFVEDASRTVGGMFRAAAPESAGLPPGYRIRGTRIDETAARVAVHRAAWHPASLPWPDGTDYTIDQNLTSRFTADHLAHVRRAELYESELDLVVESPDGTLVACCTVWLDTDSGCAEIEPLGVAPEHRRLGLASALCREAGTRVALRGGTRIFVNTAPNDDYPAPPLTYLAMGFTVVVRGHTFTRPAS